ncbi:MAG: hypothetical protein H7Y31_07730 [Chitinophagaceae bacterium]|nr:hypothetical protein [Chitinophagaceae bacterium]
MRVSFWVALGLLFTGLIILTLPDSDSQVFQINANHGPGLSDMVGITIILVTWLWMMIKIIERRKLVLLTLGKVLIAALLISIAVGAFMITWGLVHTKDNLLLAGISISVVAYFILIIPAFRTVPEQ